MIPQWLHCLHVVCLHLNAPGNRTKLYKCLWGGMPGEGTKSFRRVCGRCRGTHAVDTLLLRSVWLWGGYRGAARNLHDSVCIPSTPEAPKRSTVIRCMFGRPPACGLRDTMIMLTTTLCLLLRLVPLSFAPKRKGLVSQSFLFACLLGVWVQAPRPVGQPPSRRATVCLRAPFRGGRVARFHECACMYPPPPNPLLNHDHDNPGRHHSSHPWSPQTA